MDRYRISKGNKKGAKKGTPPAKCATPNWVQEPKGKGKKAVAAALPAASPPGKPSVAWEAVVQRQCEEPGAVCASRSRSKGP